MPRRKIPLVKNKIYHIVNKSIAGYKIFNSDSDYERMMDEILFYAIENHPCKFSLFKELNKRKSKFIKFFRANYSKRFVDIIAYCLMPTHIHFILKELKVGGIANFVNLISHSYSKYFNIKHNRKGPLWEGRFKNLLVKTDEQFIHLTRYIHINPVKAHLANNPKDWDYSSYREYMDLSKENKGICNFSDYFDMDTCSYKNFINDKIGYQRKFHLIKHLILE